MRDISAVTADDCLEGLVNLVFVLTGSALGTS